MNDEYFVELKYDSDVLLKCGFDIIEIILFIRMIIILCKCKLFSESLLRCFA